MPDHRKLLDDPPFASNAVRLTARQWLIAVAVVVIVLPLFSALWNSFEVFEPGDDYRIPHAISNDYWTYNRLADWTAKQNRVLVIGDSVVWGEYVRPGQTLSHYLNSRTKSQRFVNGGLAGTHPLALEGLMNHFAGGIGGKKVILHLNLFWLSSPERDLSETERKVDFNHPGLIPQLWPQVPAYRASVSDRLGEVVDRRLPIRRWAHHMRMSSFDSLDVHTWTVEHPYDNPLKQIAMNPPLPMTDARHDHRSWKERGIITQHMDWTPLDQSCQWGAFKRTVELLKSRNNHVLVVIGPLNAHMLTKDSKKKLEQLRSDAQVELQSTGVIYVAPKLLPAKEYADASHPLAQGYARSAREIHNSAAFQQWSK